MSYAELIDDGTLTYFHAGRRKPMPEVNALFMYAGTDDGDAANWPNPIDRLEQKGRRTNPGQGTYPRDQARKASTRDHAPVHDKKIAVLVLLATNVLPAVCAALFVAALVVLGEASRYRIWDIAIPAALAAAGCGLLLLGVFRFRRHFQTLTKQKRC